MSQVRVDFYLLKDNHRDTFWRVACRLLEKAHQNQLQIFICCKTEEDAQFLDSLLWTYQAESFLPHALIWDNLVQRSPIEIGIEYPIHGDFDLILNLTHRLPTLFSVRLQRIIEIVSADDAEKAISREHYRAYREKNYSLYTHDI
jgi:DNA polymerase-3 subunit chi